LTGSRQQRRESALWQRRFWEHLIRDATDRQQHLDYLHFNPVRHGLVSRVQDWPYSTFHRYVREGVYPPDWGGTNDVHPEGSFGEPGTRGAQKSLK
jgi:putative transposase